MLNVLIGLICGCIGAWLGRSFERYKLSEEIITFRQSLAFADRCQFIMRELYALAMKSPTSEIFCAPKALVDFEQESGVIISAETLQQLGDAGTEERRKGGTP